MQLLFWIPTFVGMTTHVCYCHTDETWVSIESYRRGIQNECLRDADNALFLYKQPRLNSLALWRLNGSIGKPIPKGSI